MPLDSGLLLSPTGASETACCLYLLVEISSESLHLYSISFKLCNSPRTHTIYRQKERHKATVTYTMKSYYWFLNPYITGPEIRLSII